MQLLFLIFRNARVTTNNKISSILFPNLLSFHLKMYSADSNDASNNPTNSSKNVLVAQISNLSDPNKSRSVKHLSFKPSPSDCPSKDYCALDLLPTAAESLFPWRRDKSYQSLGFGILHAFKFYTYIFVHLAPIRKVLCTYFF